MQTEVEEDSPPWVVYIIGAVILGLAGIGAYSIVKDETQAHRQTQAIQELNNKIDWVHKDLTSIQVVELNPEINGKPAFLAECRKSRHVHN